MKLPALPDRSNFMVFRDGPSCGSAYSPLVMLLQGQTLVTWNHGRRCAPFLTREGKQCRRFVCDGTQYPSQLGGIKGLSKIPFRSKALVRCLFLSSVLPSALA